MIKAYIKEDDVTIGISIVTINAVKPLWELDIAKLLTQLRIHQETHGFSDCLAIVDVVITIKIQNEGCICKDCRHSNLEKRNYMTLSVNTLNSRNYLSFNTKNNTDQCIHGTSFFVVLVTRPFFAGDIYKAW